MTGILRTEEGGMVRLAFFLPKDQVGYARFILEAYDNLAIQTTAPGSTLVEWHMPADSEAEARALLDALLKEILA